MPSRSLVHSFSSSSPIRLKIYPASGRWVDLPLIFLPLVDRRRLAALLIEIESNVFVVLPQSQVPARTLPYSCRSDRGESLTIARLYLATSFFCTLIFSARFYLLDFHSLFSVAFYPFWLKDGPRASSAVRSEKRSAVLFGGTQRRKSCSGTPCKTISIGFSRIE